MLFVKKLLASIALPPTSLVLLALFGLWLERRHRRLGRSIAVTGVVAIFVLSLPPVANALMGTLEIHPPISGKDLANAQAIVILGGGLYLDAPEYGGDNLRGRALERIRYGAYLQTRSKLPVLISSGSPLGGRPEGDVMKEVLEREFHIPVKWVENASNDTGENASYTGAMLKNSGITRIALVSSAAHLRRAAGYFQDQGFDVLPAPTGFFTRSRSTFLDFLPSASSLNLSSEALSEWLGILVQQVVLGIRTALR